MSTSTGLKKAFLTWLKQQRKPMASNQPAALFHHCNQLPFSNFLRCLLDGDLSALIISGNPSQGDLAECWANIYYEYVSLSDDPETRYFIFLQRDITLLFNEISTVETSLYLLSPVMLPFSFDHKEALVKSIKDFGYKITIDFGTDYSPALEAVQNKLAPKKQKLANKEKEILEYMQSKQGKSVDREYFTKILIRLSKYQGYPVRINDITVSEYVALLKDYISYIESSKNEITE